MNSYFQCTLCDYKRICDNPNDYLRFDTDKGLMIDHYKWDHADDIGTKVHLSPIEWRYEYRPIPDDIGPSFYDSEANEVYSWEQLKQYA